MTRSLATALVISFSTACLLCGCTSQRLERSISNQATTLADIQFQQVLNNLAAFGANPYTLPSQVGIHDGSAQVQDSATTSTGLDILHDVTTSIGLQGSRTVVEQWGVSPITDDIELRLLKIAYQRASGTDAYLSLDLANDIARELSRQTAETGDIDERNSFSTYNRFRDRFLDASLSQVAANIKDIPAYKDGLREALLVDAIATERLIGTNDPQIILDDQDLMTLDPYFYFMTMPDGNKVTKYFTPLASSSRREVRDIREDLDQIHSGWLHKGCKEDIPRDACYIGHYRSCGKDCYAWVCNDGLDELSDFTIKILKFSSLIKDRSVVTIPGGGPRFTPTPPR